MFAPPHRQRAGKPAGQGQQQATKHGHDLGALAGAAPLPEVGLDHLERHALDLALEAVLEGGAGVVGQQVEVAEQVDPVETRLCLVGELEEAGEFVHHELLHVGLQVPQRNIADDDHGDGAEENGEYPEVVPLSGHDVIETHGQQRETAADDEPAQPARLATAALLRLEPGFELRFVEAAKRQEFGPRRGIGGGLCRHGRDAPFRLG